MQKGIITSVLSFILLLFITNAAQAATCTVNTVDDTGAGAGGAGGSGDLRYCITQTNAAGGADIINVTVTGTVLLNSNLPYISDSLTINGNSQTNFIIDAQNGSNRRGFEVDAASGVTVTIRSLTITRGNITSNGIGSGGGISLISGATLNLDSVNITGNTSVDGGAGIYVNGSNLSVTNSRITGNNATGNGAGGGAINFFNGTLFMTGTTLSGNTSSVGGAIAFVFVNPARIENSTISGNNAVRGGGFYSAASTVRISNATISGNTASELGGGFVVANNGSNVLLRNSTVAGNSATNSGGGFYNFGDPGLSTTIANTIIADNFAVNGADVLNNLGGAVLREGANIIESGIAGSGGIGGGGFHNQVDPQLNPLANNGGLTQTQSFAPNSPARDTGAGGEALDTSGAALATDQRGAGFSRVTGSTVDLGAYEFNSLVVTKITDTNDGVCDADCSLREAIAALPSGGEIQFSALFDTPQTITLGSLISTTNKQMRITGKGADKLTISGGGTTSLFEALSTSGTIGVNFSGMTFANGNGTGGVNGNQGGAIEINSSALATFDRVVFRDNSASALGGALLCFATVCQISNSSFINNSAPSASVTYNGSGTFEMTNTTVSGNTETSSTYGALYLRGNSIIRNSTIANNSGRSNFYVSTESVLVTIANTIVAGGGTSDFVHNGGTITSNGGNFIGNNFFATTPFPAGMPNLSGDYVGTNSSPINPLLAPLGNYGGTTPTRALLQNSPALNRGNNCVLNNSCSPALSAALTTDQRGVPRKIGALVDIGAFEQNITFDQNSIPNGSVGIFYDTQLTATRQTSLAELTEKTDLAESFAPTSFALIPVSGQSFPPGLNLSLSGQISGFPTTPGLYNFTVAVTDTDGYSGVIQYALRIFAPTAANVSVSGKVLTSDDRGLSGAIVTLTDSNGNTRTVRSTSFGNFQFDDVAVGQTYVVSVISKRYQFTPQVLTINEDVTELNLTAEP